MCGIAGIWGNYSQPQKDEALELLSQQLAHRGPDGTGTYQDPVISLLHKRLSIIDLSESGNQPLFNEDRSLVLICNGEIYNYRAIREELTASGHIFASHSDSEVILHLYEEYDAGNSTGNLGFHKLLDRLTGMFAFALWDLKLQKLFIARDRLGIKPLYYYYNDANLVFASEVRALAVSGLFSPTHDPTSLYEYLLLGIIPGPNTLYKEIKCLPPGHFAVRDRFSFTIMEYWDIPLVRKKWRDAEKVRNYLGNLLNEIIKDHLVADVPVGSFLSAGIDSSLITAIAARQHPGIHTFTASFPGEPEDEGVVAAGTARSLGATHHPYEIKSDFFQDFTDQVAKVDQPFAPNSALSLGRISKLAQKVVKVVLSGDGGDELFAGYGRYEPPKRPAFLKVIPPFCRNGVLRIMTKVTGKKSLDDLRLNLQASKAFSFYVRIAIAREEEVARLFSESAFAVVDKTRFLRHLEELFEKRKDKDTLNQALYVEVKTILVDEMLTKCDRMTMINGIEGRVPFLDHRFVEAAFSIPSRFKRHSGVGKLPLRNLLAGLVSVELAFRKKTGFNTPLTQWLENDAPTRDFVHKEIKTITHFPFLDEKEVSRYSDSPEHQKPVLVYALVSLAEYLESERSARTQ